jgi:hypothetical protein
LLYPVSFSAGFFAYGLVLALAHWKELFPQQIVGTALTLSNFFAVMGIAVLKYLMGWLIERYPVAGAAYPPETNRDAFFLLAAGIAVVLILYSRTPEKERPAISTIRQRTRLSSRNTAPGTGLWQ